MNTGKFNPGYKSHPYWRKHKLNGRLCVPVNLSLENDGTFSMKDKTGVVFEVPVKEVSFRLTNFGTLVLTIRGVQYDIVKMGAMVSPLPSLPLREEMAEYFALFDNIDETGIDPMLHNFLADPNSAGKWVPVLESRYK